MKKIVEKVEVGKYYSLNPLIPSNENIYTWECLRELINFPAKCLSFKDFREKGEGLSKKLFIHLRGFGDFLVCKEDLIEYTEKGAMDKIKKIKNEVYFGIEIECLYKLRDRDFDVGAYHSGDEITDYWGAENDSSISCSFENSEDEEYYCGGCGDCRDCNYGDYHEDRVWEGIEFVSKKLKGKSEFVKALEEFKQIIGKGKELKEIMLFNQSCGCHLHIGFNKKRLCQEKMGFEKMKEIREMFFNQVKGNKILSKETQENVLKQYFRSYAKETNKRKWEGSRYHRSEEFNKSSEKSKGLEWRSFNLRGVKNWKEFDEMFRIGLDCLSHLSNLRLNGWEDKEKNLPFNRCAIKKRDLEQKEDSIFTLKKIRDLKPQKIKKGDFKEKINKNITIYKMVKRV